MLAASNLGADKEEAKLEEIAAITKEKNRLHQVENERNLRANPTRVHIELTCRNGAKQRLALKRIHVNEIANKTFHCEP